MMFDQYVKPVLPCHWILNNLNSLPIVILSNQITTWYVATNSSLNPFYRRWTNLASWSWNLSSITETKHLNSKVVGGCFFGLMVPSCGESCCMCSCVLGTYQENIPQNISPETCRNNNMCGIYVCSKILNAICPFGKCMVTHVTFVCQRLYVCIIWATLVTIRAAEWRNGRVAAVQHQRPSSIRTTGAICTEIVRSPCDRVVFLLVLHIP